MHLWAFAQGNSPFQASVSPSVKQGLDQMMFLSIPALKFLGQIPRTIQARAKFLTMLK
jgi:hypothetical protein